MYRAFPAAWKFSLHPTSVHHPHDNTRSRTIPLSRTLKGATDPSNSIDASGHLLGLAFPCGKRLPRWPSERVLACGPDALDGLSHPCASQRDGGSGAAREM